MKILAIMRLPRSGKRVFRNEIKAGLRAIDRTLRLPDLPPVAVTFTESRRYGGYTPGTDERGIELSLRTPTPRLTTVHEVGHFLDDALGNFEVYSSMEPGTPVNRVAFREFEEQARNIVPIPLERAQVLNRLHVVEIWARCFAQYIALRSEEEHLREDILLRRAMEAGVLVNEQWEEEDFAPVAQEMDAMFKTLRWL
jgi:hypothetical protein